MLFASIFVICITSLQDARCEPLLSLPIQCDSTCCLDPCPTTSLISPALTADCSCLLHPPMIHRPLSCLSAGIADAYHDVASIFPFPHKICPTCVTHKLEKTICPVVDECVSHVPVVKKFVRHEEEQFTRHVPIVEKVITPHEEKFIRHVPVARKFTKPVVECCTRHVPVVRHRTRTVIEPYTTHVPITEKFTRPIEETVICHVPVVEKCLRPIVHHHVRTIPITERILKPVVESQLINVPVKRCFLKNLVEQKVRAVHGPCECCPPCIPSPRTCCTPLSLPGHKISSLLPHCPFLPPLLGHCPPAVSLHCPLSSHLSLPTSVCPSLPLINTC